jgi:hypothetical protein
VGEPKTLVSGADNVLQANQSVAGLSGGDPSGLNATR